MTKKSLSITPFALLAVVIFLTCVTESAPARIETRGKAFAVFVVSYNRSGSEARGGVAGTAFFVEGGRALTAYHVLQPSSFHPQPGFEKARVWLVHEDHAPIELRESELSFRPDRDQTWIALDRGRKVENRFVFSMKKRAPRAAESLETEGFVAETTGPVLAREGEDLVIVSVPRLTRLHFQGELLQSTRVDLQAADVKLSNAPCLKVSYRPVRGISGGPVLAGGEVVGMNSFADPGGVAQTWVADLTR